MFPRSPPLVRSVLAAAAAIASLLPGLAPAQAFTDYPIPTPSAGPVTITNGPDGNLWFTELQGNKIGRITTAGVITEFTVPTPSAGPNGITLGSDGNLWFTEFLSTGNKIGRITPLGAITEFTIPTGASIPQGITAGADGNLWFTESSGNKIARITPAGVFTEFPLPIGGSNPRRLAVGPDRAMWFTEGGGRIGRIQTGAPNTITEFTVPTVGGSPFDIVAGPDGALWFTEANIPKIGRITISGSITEYPVSGQPLLITVGHDGALYFNEGSGNKIGRITTAGVLTEYATSIPASSGEGVVAGPDGAIWFTEAGNIGRMLLDPARVANISARSLVLTGNNVMIAGIIIQGNTPQTVAITATGPSLVPFGVTNPLPNPTLTVVRSSDMSIVATNDDWQSDPNAAQLLASGFAPTDSLEAGLVLTLPPGAYTAIVSGAGGATGVSVVGVFAIP